MRTLVTITAALVLLACWQPRSAAQDFGIEPERKLDRALRKIADVMFECGDKAKEKGLYSYTRSFFNYGLEYDTDHRAIRRTMGFKKRRGEWVRGEDMVPASDRIDESRRAELLAGLREDTAKVRREAAENLFDHFVADTELPREQRLLALYHVVRIYPEHRGAQKATRTSADKLWFKHELDRVADVNRAVWIARGDKGAETEELTEYERAMGYDMPSRRNDWLVVHVDMTRAEPSRQWAETLIQYADACRMRNFEMLGLEPPETAPAEDAQRLHYTVFNDRDKFATFVERCSGIRDASDRKARAQSGGTPVYNPYGAVWLYPNTDDDYVIRDAMAHDLAYKEVVRHTRSENLYWLPRGLAYLASTKMNGSVRSQFYAVRSTGVFDTGGADALPGFGPSAAGWRLEVGLRVAGGTATGVGELTGMRPKDYSQDEMAAAFCFADYLESAHKQKLGEFLKSAYREAISRQREEKQPESSAELLKRLLETLELDEEEFNQGFRKWALENYFDLPAEE